MKFDCEFLFAALAEKHNAVIRKIREIPPWEWGGEFLKLGIIKAIRAEHAQTRRQIIKAINTRNIDGLDSSGPRTPECRDQVLAVVVFLANPKHLESAVLTPHGFEAHVYVKEQDKVTALRPGEIYSNATEAVEWVVPRSVMTQLVIANEGLH